MVMETLVRSKNAGRELIDYDLNIFMQEIEDPITGEFYYDPTSWAIDVYEYRGAGHEQLGIMYMLSPEEIRSMGLNNDEYFEGGDCWYGMAGYLKDYWAVLPDSVKQFLEALPKYK